MDPLIVEDVITIRQLKDYVKDLPETDPYTGDDYELWIDGTDCESGLSNPARSLWRLNKGDLIIHIDRK